MKSDGYLRRCRNCGEAFSKPAHLNKAIHLQREDDGLLGTEWVPK